MAAAVVGHDDRLGAEIDAAQRVVGAQHAFHHDVDRRAADQPFEVAPGRRKRDRAGVGGAVAVGRRRLARQVDGADVGRGRERGARRARARAVDRLIDRQHDGAKAGGGDAIDQPLGDAAIGRQIELEPLWRQVALRRQVAQPRRSPPRPRCSPSRWWRAHRARRPPPRRARWRARRRDETGDAGRSAPPSAAWRCARPARSPSCRSP